VLSALTTFFSGLLALSSLVSHGCRQDVPASATDLIRCFRKRFVWNVVFFQQEEDLEDCGEDILNVGVPVKNKVVTCKLEQLFFVVSLIFFSSELYSKILWVFSLSGHSSMVSFLFQDFLITSIVHPCTFRVPNQLDSVSV
jgi:hypothetical protein